MVDGLNGLRLDAVLRRNDEDGDIRDHRAAGTHGGERLVARGIEEGDGLALDLHLIGADVLGDAARLAGGDVGIADIVEQARLAVVDVTHDDDDRRAGLELVGAVLVIFSSIVTTTSFSTLQPSSSATKDAVSKSIIWERDAITPFFIRHLTTSAPVFFMREASSPTEISSGILTVSGVFFAISSCRRRIFSASSCLRLPENGC